MNLICQLRDFFFREETSASSYDQLLADLNRACSHLPEGQAFLVTGDGEFTVRLIWKPQQANPEKRMFSLNGQDEVTEWVEAAPASVALTLPETALCFPLQYADGTDGMCPSEYRKSR